VLPRAQRQGVGVIVRSVLLRGVLSHRYRFLPAALEDLKAAIERLAELADAEASSLPEMAYRFVLGHPAVATALVGTARDEELEAALAFAGRGMLAPTLVARIREITVSDRAQLDPSTWPSEMGAWQGQTK